MRPTRLVAGLTLAAAMAGSLAWQASHLPDSRSFAQDEVARLRTHFAIVETDLLARDVSSLSQAQRIARAELVRQLRRYSAEGRFPKNEHFPGHRVPYFRDAHGTLCAMAFLIDATGGGDLVDRVARTRNNAYLPDLADEPGLTEWLDDHGLTLAEGTRIQPTYGDEQKYLSTAFEVTSIGAATLSGVTMVLNFPGVTHTRWPGILGMAAGGLMMGLGVSKIDDQASFGGLGAAQLAVGAATATLGLWSMTRAEHREK